jgi:hypothetical protein
MLTAPARCPVTDFESALPDMGPSSVALVGLLGIAFPLSLSKTQELLDQLLGLEISRGTIATIRLGLSAALE